MKIEVGKYYKTRDGRKAYVNNKLDGFKFKLMTSLVYQGLVQDVDGFWDTISWKEDGNHIYQDFKIISEWHDPIKVEGWINIYEECQVLPCQPTFHYTKEKADKSQLPGRVACIKVTGVEGEE